MAGCRLSIVRAMIGRCLCDYSGATQVRLNSGATHFRKCVAPLHQCDFGYFWWAVDSLGYWAGANSPGGVYPHSVGVVEALGVFFAVRDCCH